MEIIFARMRLFAALAKINVHAVVDTDKKYWNCLSYFYFFSFGKVVSCRRGVSVML